MLRAEKCYGVFFWCKTISHLKEFFHSYGKGVLKLQLSRSVCVAFESLPIGLREGGGGWAGNLLSFCETKPNLWSFRCENLVHQVFLVGSSSLYHVSRRLEERVWGCPQGALRKVRGLLASRYCLFCALTCGFHFSLMPSVFSVQALLGCPGRGSFHLQASTSLKV